MRGLGLPIVAALSLIGVVVASMSATMVVTVRSLDSTSKSQRATSQMTQESLRLERLVVDLETGVRGYMLTDDPRFLEPYRAGRLRLATSLARLHALDARTAAAPESTGSTATSRPTSTTTPSR